MPWTGRRNQTNRGSAVSCAIGWVITLEIVELRSTLRVAREGHYPLNPHNLTALTLTMPPREPCVPRASCLTRAFTKFERLFEVEEKGSTPRVMEAGMTTGKVPRIFVRLAFVRNPTMCVIILSSEAP